MTSDQFGGLNPAIYPIVVTAFAGETILWERVVLADAPAADLPPLPNADHGKIAIRIKYADGTEVWQDP